MYSSQVVWRISVVIKSLNDKNAKELAKEVSDLIRMHGDETRVFYIASLVDEIDFRDQRSQGNRDSQKIAILREEIIRCLELPNFVSIVCQSLEGGSRHSILEQGGQLSEEFLSNICTSLSFSDSQTAAFCFALSHSKYRTLSLNARILLRSKLPELSSVTACSDIPESILHGLIGVIHSSEELRVPEISGAFIQAVRSLSYTGPMTVRPGSNLDADGDLSQRLSVPVRQRVSIASLLSDLGPQHSSSQEHFAQTIKGIAIPIDEEQIAELIVLVIPRTQSNVQHGEDQNPESEQWNLENVANVLAQECRSLNLNWTLVAQRLDQPNLVVRSQLQFELLTRLFVRISGVAMPAAGLMRLWANRAAQLAILILGTKAARNVVDFSALVTADQYMAEEVPTPQNFSWVCLPLYSILLELAAAGMSRDVLEAFAQASGANGFPEYILIGLAQVTDPSTGVRAEILRRTLPMFTGLPGSRPTSTSVMKRLLVVNPDLLVLLFRIALKRANSVQDMAEVDARLRTMGQAVARRVEEEGTVDELLGYWCVRADRSDLDLEQLATEVLKRNPALARSFVAFAKAHAEYLRPRASDGGLLSFESFVVLIRAIQLYPTIVQIEDMRALATIYHNHTSRNAGGPTPGQGIQASSTSGAIPAMSQQSMESSVPPGDLAQHDLSRAPESDEVEEEANAYFQRIYTSDITIAEVIQLLKKFKTSDKVKEQEIFRCMIHNLFDEYRFFHKYPEKELQVTGRLFGALIFHQLVSSITLGIALRYVLEAVRKDPDQGGSNEKMFRFGKIALEQFRSRLSEWPQYCSHLVQISHFAVHCPELFQDANMAINNPAPTPSPPTVAQSGRDEFASPVPSGGAPSQQPASGVGSDQTEGLSRLAASGPAPQVVNPTGPSNTSNGSTNGSIDMVALGNSNGTAGAQLVAATSGTVGLSVAAATPTDGAAMALAQQVAAMSLSPTPEVRVSSSEEPPEAVLAAPAEVETAAVGSALAASASGDAAGGAAPSLRPTMTIIEKMTKVNVDVPNTPVPPDSVRDQILFIINNIAKDNCEVKTQELRQLLSREYFNWFASYLILKRISTMPNLHPIYLSVLDTLDCLELLKVILDLTYHHSTKLLQSPNITQSSAERSLLRNLGIWLGQITLARNRPLLLRRINIKELLLWGYENARLIAVCSFVAKIIEGVKESKIFRPPNPWLMAILGVMRELYEIDDLKMNIKFEVQVLCKNVNIKIEDIPRGNVLSSRRTPLKDQRNPDFSIRSSNVLASPLASSSPVPGASYGNGAPLPPPLEESAKLKQGAAGGAADASGASSAAQEQTVIPNLAEHIMINPTLQFFASNPNQKRLVSLAVDRAIREIIQPVVERSVTIANVTTRHLVLKDFSSEPNEAHLRTGAHLMIANLARSLALVTCKEPLRLSISNHLRTLLGQTTAEAATIDQIVQVCANDNLELGCFVIEKASTEKAIRDIDESIATAMQQRKKQRETGQPFVDTVAQAARTSTFKYPRELPEALKPRPGGLAPHQMSVYQAFQHARVQPPVVNAQPPEGSPVVSQSLPATDVPPLGQGLQQQPQQVLFSMAQALEAYQVVLQRLDAALKTVQLQAPGRDVSISMLGGDHEILNHLRDIIMVTQRTQPAARNDTAMAFCETVFRRLMEAQASVDALRLEVVIGIIDTIRETLGGMRKFSPDIVKWLNEYSTFNASDETARKIHRAILLLLLRAKLLKTQDIDGYFATNMGDRGQVIVWVELALMFITQCLGDGIAQTYEFPTTFETVSKMRPSNATLKKQLQKWLTDLRALASSREAANGGAAAAAASARDGVRDQVKILLEKWLRVWNSSNDQVFSQYLQLMHQYGVFKTEDAADKFFRVSTELCVEACIKSGQSAAAQPPGEAPLASGLTFTVIDALSKLFLLLVRLADKEATDITVRVNLLSRILQAVARTLHEDHENKKNSKQSFDQRPYFRLLSNLSQDLGVPDPKAEPNPSLPPLLGTYYQIYLALQPAHLPGFAFAWLQLISHRSFMPHLLLVKGQKCWPHLHRLIIFLLMFLQPFLKHAQLNDSIRRLYKGTLRVLLVLLHDFPEFLCDFHLPLCDHIPTTCVQLRNLILSAFPRSMRLPDPFTPNLKVDMLPEILHAPRIPPDYLAVLQDKGIKARLDAFIASKQPPEPDLPALIPSFFTATAAAGGATVYNISLMTAIVVYIGAQAIVQLQNKQVQLQSSRTMEIFNKLVAVLDAEGRYNLFNAMANQLRYPNSHTHFFSCVLLSLFADAENEFLQEQITRVLLERLIVHRPHPWGLLITFIELIKNPRYGFWRRSFTRCAPEIERVFESVARSCMGPAASATMQQQQQQQLPTSNTPAAAADKAPTAR